MNYLYNKVNGKLHAELRTVEEVRYLFVCTWVIGQHGPKTGRRAIEEEEGYCVTTSLAMQHENKQTEHTADDDAVTSVFSGTLTPQYI